MSSHTQPPAPSSRIAEAEAWALEALPAARRAGPEVERPALYALGWARGLRGRPIDDLCERFRAASDAASYIADSPERVAGQRLVWRGERATGRARRLHPAPVARRRAGRAGRPTRCSGCTCASSSCAPATGRRPRGCSTSGPSPPTATCWSPRCTSAAARCLPRAAVFPTRRERWAAPAIAGARGDRRPLGRARGAAGARDRRPARARAGAGGREPAHGLGAHASARASTSPARSRSRPISSRRSRSSASSTRRGR